MKEKPIYVIPDTNILKDYLDTLIGYLKPYRESIVIALSQIQVDELLKPPRERPRRRLYRLVCLREHRTEEFLRSFESLRKKIAEEGFKIEVVEVPFILDITRLGFGRPVSNEDNLLLSAIIRVFMGRESNYYSTLKHVAFCIDKSDVLSTDIIKAFWELLNLCCSKLLNEDQCKEQCARFFNIVGDMLILHSATYPLRLRKGSRAIIVTNDMKLHHAVEKLRQDPPLTEVQALFCASINNVINIIKKGDLY